MIYATMPPAGQRRRVASDATEDEQMGSLTDLEAGHPSKIQESFKAVVKVYCASAPANFKQPWSRRAQIQSTASGFIISGRRILTNAHAVADATMVQVRKHGQADKIPARILAVSHCSDVAVLTVDGAAGDAFFGSSGAGAGTGADGAAMELALAKDLPQLQDEVLAVGFPIGGDQLSVTSGVVSRISFGPYSHSNRELLYAQVSSPINPGNSGGPVFAVRPDGKALVVGIAFQSLEHAEGVGYIIPVPVVRHVLAEVQRAGVALPKAPPAILPDFPLMGLYFQDLQNPHLKTHLRMPAGTTGVRVARLAPAALSEASKHLQVDDVITHCAGYAIADDSTVAFRKDERLPFPAVLVEKPEGTRVPMKLLRKGVPMDVSVPLEVIPRLVSWRTYDISPTYLVWAGFVMIHLSEPYLESQYGRDFESKAPVRLLNLLYHGEASAPGESCVVITDVLGHVLNAGYEADEFAGDIVKAVHLPNGKSVKATSLSVVAAALQEAAAMAGPGAGGAGAGAAPINPDPAVIRLEVMENRMVVLPVIEAEAATLEVCEQHAIAYALSADLRKSQGGGAVGAGAGAGAGAAKVSARSKVPVKDDGSSSVSSSLPGLLPALLSAPSGSSSAVSSTSTSNVTDGDAVPVAMEEKGKRGRKRKVEEVVDLDDDEGGEEEEEEDRAPAPAAATPADKPARGKPGPKPKVAPAPAPAPAIQAKGLGSGKKKDTAEEAKAQKGKATATPPTGPKGGSGTAFKLLWMM